MVGGDSGAVVTAQVNNGHVNNGDIGASALVSDTAGRSDSLSWASLANADADAWTEVSRLKNKTTSMTKPPVRVKGTKKENSETRKVTAVPRESILAAFVGRLHIDTTEEELTTYLADAGIRGVRCKKLKAKNGRQFTTAAFYVTCCQESRDLFYDENNWPEGSELRDWVYFQR